MQTATQLRLFAVVFAVSAAMACGPDETPLDPCAKVLAEMTQRTDTKATGLYLTANPLDAPNGALSQADNVVLRRPGITEPRRGQCPDVVFPAEVDSFTTFEGSIIAHSSDGKLSYRKTQDASLSRVGSSVTVVSASHGLNIGDTFSISDTSSQTAFPDGTKTVVSVPDADTLTYTEIGAATSGTASINSVVEYSGTYTPTAVPGGGQQNCFAEAGGGLYVTTEDGLYRLDSLDGQPTLAGIPPGLEGKAEVTGDGWLEYGQVAAYRLVWARRDGDGDLLLGPPSGRIIVTNLNTVAISDMDRAAGAVTATMADTTPLGIVGATGVLEVVTSSNTGVISLGDKTYTVTSATQVTWTETGGADGTDVTGTYAGSPTSVNITTPIPDGIVHDDNFLQIYRTIVIGENGADPGEDMALVDEVFPTQADIAARFLTTEDISPFANGAPAYFAPSEGIGLLASKNPPPLITDLVSFKGVNVGVVKCDFQGVTLSLKSVGGTSGLLANDQMVFAISSILGEEYVYVPGLAEGTSLGPTSWTYDGNDPTVSAASDIEAAVRSLVRVINLRSQYFYATYSSGVNDPPGTIRIRKRTLDQTPFTVWGAPYGRMWTPSLRNEFTINTLTRAANVVTFDNSPENMRLKVGDEIQITSTDPNFPSGIKTIASVVSPSIYTYNEVGPNASATGILAADAYPDVRSTSGGYLNEYALSALEEYDAWPPAYRYRVGGAQSTLYRIIQQNDALIFYTSNGFYRLTGNDPTDFNLQPIDSTARLVAPKTAVALSGKNLALTDQGVVLIDQLSVRVVSGPINEELKNFYAGTKALKDAIFTDAYAFANESEQEYWLGLPSTTAPTGGITQFYVLNLITGGWTRVPMNTVTGFTHPEEGRMYFQPDTEGTAAITRERRDRALTDYQDAQGVGIPSVAAYQVQVGGNPGAGKQWVAANIMLDRPQPATVTMGFATELSPNYYGNLALPSRGNGYIRTGIPLNASRSRTLTVKMSHSTALEAPKILGITTEYNVHGVKAGK